MCIKDSLTKYHLLDDGTMDTVVEAEFSDGRTVVLRFCPHFASQWRDTQGVLDLAKFVNEALYSGWEEEYN